MTNLKLTACASQRVIRKPRNNEAGRTVLTDSRGLLNAKDAENGFLECARFVSKSSAAAVGCRVAFEVIETGLRSFAVEARQLWPYLVKRTLSLPNRSF